MLWCSAIGLPNCTLAGVEQGGLEGRTGDAQGLRADADASAFEVRQRNRQALATLAKQVGLRDSAVAERDRAGIRGADAHLVFAAFHREAGRVGGHQKRGKTLLAEVRIGHREDDGQLRPLGIAAELLAAVEHPLAVHPFGAGAQVVRLGAGLRFGEGEAADGATAGQFSQPLVLLRLRAVIQHRAAAHRIVDAHQRAGGAVAGGDFLHGQGVGDVVDIAAAPFFRDDHAEQAKLSHLGDQGVVDPAGLFPGLCMGAISRRAKSRAMSRIMRWSSLSSRSCIARSLLVVVLQRGSGRGAAACLAGGGLEAVEERLDALRRDASVGGFQRGDLSLSMISARTPSMMSPLANH